MKHTILILITLCSFAQMSNGMEDVLQKRYDKIITTHIQELSHNSSSGHILSALALSYLFELAQDDYNETVPFVVSEELNDRKLVSFKPACKLNYCFTCSDVCCGCFGCYYKIQLKPEIAAAIKRKKNYDTQLALRNALKTQRDALEKKSQKYMDDLQTIMVLDNKGIIPYWWIPSDYREAWDDKNCLRTKLEQAWRTRGDQ